MLGDCIIIVVIVVDSIGMMLHGNFQESFLDTSVRIGSFDLQYTKGVVLVLVELYILVVLSAFSTKGLESDMTRRCWKNGRRVKCWQGAYESTSRCQHGQSQTSSSRCGAINIGLQG